MRPNDRLARLFPVLVVGLVVGIASAAPPSRGKGGKPGRELCAEPNGTTCGTAAYIASGCAAENAAVCKPLLEKKLEAAYKASSAPEAKMLRVHGNELPKDLKTGKHHAYTGPKSKAKLAGSFPQVATVAGRGAVPKPRLSPMSGASRTRSTAAAKLGTARGTTSIGRSKSVAGIDTMTSDNIIARTGLTRPPTSGTASGLPVGAVRNPAWEKDGEAITSCEEYAYDQLYDWTRFTDAAAACAGDDQCVLDIAFLPSTPGIADRTLKRKDGKALAKQYLLAKDQVVPKNDMFALGADFVHQFGTTGILPPNAASEELKAVMLAGERYYAIACTSKACKGTRSFTDEWDFHRKLYDEHRKLSPAEFAEYDRRKAEFRALASAWAQAAKKEHEQAMKGSRKQLMHRWVNPLDTLTRDPFERVELLQTWNAQISKAAAGKRTAPRGGSAPRTKVGALPLFDPDAGPTFALASASAPAPGKKGGMPTYSDCKPAAGKWGKEMFHAGPLACRLSVFLYQEYQRKKDGHKSCLDLDNHDCDWSPAMFEARFVEGVPYVEEQNKYETDCLDYTADKFTKPVANLVAAEAYIAAMKKEISKALKAVSPYFNEAKTGFGRNWTDQDEFGDKDWLAGGYAYDVGWDVVAKQKAGKDVCHLEGGMHGSFEALGWLMATKHTVAEARADLDVNRGGSKQSKLDAKLVLLGNEVAGFGPQQFTAAWEQPLAKGSMQIPSGYKPSFNFMAGPIPVTGAIWGELAYGADLRVEGLAEASQSCEFSEVKFGARSIFTPYAAVNAKAQVGVGVSGLVSAGIRGVVNLVTIGVPMDTSLATKFKAIEGQSQAVLAFALDPRLSISTLSGYLALYLEFLFYEEEWEIFRWNGVGPVEINLLGKPLNAELPLLVLAD